MKYDYLVKHNGVYYQAGEEVPDGIETPKVEATESAKSNIAEVKVAEEPKFDVSTIADKEDAKVNTLPKFSKTEIMKMPKAMLEDVCKKCGIEITEGTSGTDLKKILIKHYGVQENS